MDETRVDTEVSPENGQWTVWLIVTTPDGVERRPLRTCFTEAEARIIATTLGRSVARRRSLTNDPWEGGDDDRSDR